MTTIYALNDIHGYYDEMLSTLQLIDLNNNPNNKLIFLGDYINRGKNSCKVLYKIIELEEEYPNQVIVLLGNHDVAFIEWLTNKIEYFEWSPLDIGQYTIRSFYSEKELEKIKQLAIQKNYTESQIYQVYSRTIQKKHPALISWLKFKYQNERYFETENQIYVHAGIYEEYGDFWKHATEDFVFTEKFPAQTGSFYKDIIAGHVSSATVAEDDSFLGKVYWDGESHFYIDGNTPESRNIPLLKYNTETKVYSSFEKLENGTMQEYVITKK